MTDTELAKLQERVANGLVWLAENDTLGRFHLWYEARISPLGPLPGLEGTPEVRAAFVDYTKRRNLWERLSKELARQDPSWRDSKPQLGGPLQWQGNPKAIRG